MRTIEEKAEDAWTDYCYRADGSLYSTCFQDGYIQGATEALQSQWREFPIDKDGFTDEDAIDKIAMPILVRYQDGYVFAINYDWSEEAGWYNDILNHPNRYTWMPIPKHRAKGGEE